VGARLGPVKGGGTGRSVAPTHQRLLSATAAVSRSRPVSGLSPLYGEPPCNGLGAFATHGHAAISLVILGIVDDHKPAPSGA